LNVLKDSVKGLNESWVWIRCEKQEIPSPLCGGQNVCSRAWLSSLSAA
jgi:hypothetical protein